MVPGGYVKWGQVKSGRIGIPAVVLGFGNFRLMQQGPCGFVVADNPRSWEKSKVVVLRQKGSFYRSYAPDTDLGVITPTTEWQLDLVNQHQLLPVDVWKTFHDEYNLLVMDTQAMELQQKTLRKNRSATIMADPAIRQALIDLLDGGPDDRERMTITVGDDAVIKFNGIVSVNRLSANTRAIVAKFDEQIAALQTKLECVR